MNNTGYVIWFIATTIATISIMTLGIAASVRGVSNAQKQAHAAEVHAHGHHLRLVPHFREHHDRHHAA